VRLPSQAGLKLRLQRNKIMDRFFTKFSSRSAMVLGHPYAFVISSALILIWAATGPMLNYSDTWQLVVNTATTVLTFLAVFLIQNSQNRDGAAIQAKLDEILRAMDNARGELAGIEHLTEPEISAIRGALECEIRNNGSLDDESIDTVDDLLQRLNAPTDLL
jgi:low affinity Fe/Cu permease